MRKAAMILVTASTVLIAGFAWGQGMHGQNPQSRMSTGMMGQHNHQQSWGSMTGGGMNGMGMMNGTMGGSMSGYVPSVYTILNQSGTLNLTDDQESALQKEALELQKNLIQIRSQAAIANVNLREALDSSKPNQQSIQKVLQNKLDAQSEMQKTLLSSYFQGWDNLTSDQQATLQTTGAGCMMMASGNSNGVSGMHGMMGQQ